MANNQAKGLDRTSRQKENSKKKEGITNKMQRKQDRLYGNEMANDVIEHKLTLWVDLRQLGTSLT